MDNFLFYTVKSKGTLPYTSKFLCFSLFSCFYSVVPLAELAYDGKPVTISGDTVTIGSLTFTRRNGVAVDVSIAGGLSDLTRELNALSMTLDDIYAGKIYMDDAALVANLGQHIKAEATAVWGADSVVVRTPDLPQTGSAPVYVGFVMILAALTLGVRVWAKR